MTRQRGLTLPELLIALLVFAMVATAAVFALRLGVEARDQIKEAEARIAELQIANVLIKEDMAQIRARQVRDEYGEVEGPPFRGGDAWRPRQEAQGERRLLAFVRAGWSNPGGDAPRSELQYVEYIEKNGGLVRRIRPFLDDARGQPRFDRVLIRNTRNLTFRFLLGESALRRGELDWIDVWPSPGETRATPLALAVGFEADRYGEMEQLFWIGDLAAPRAER
ncbi:MAG: type II secretion system minor pseudopilin GspJ [Parvularculaceae bacterium]|jgi:general secretion pathway protein J|nr:type II secretion system minor pseudopilin GspJ [Parvularculaceae bacterium]